MREGIATFDFQMQLVDERERLLIVKQKLLDFCAKCRIFLAFKEELETKAVGFFKADEGLGATFRQCEANRRILRGC